MRIDHRDLHVDFPELNDRIHQLKISDAHFAKLYGEYDALNHQIRHIEENDSMIGDAELETLKFKRLHLKDALYALLTKPA